MLFIIICCCVCVCVDVESVMNSIVSLLLILEAEKQEALIESLCEKLVKFREGDRPTLRMQLYVHSTLVRSSFPSLDHPRARSFTHPHALPFTRTCSPTRSLFHSFSPSLTHLFTHPFTHPLISLSIVRPVLHPFFCSPTHSSIDTYCEIFCLSSYPPA